MDTSFETRLEKLKTMIANSKHIVFFGGAGVSTESGIPDFRSKNGLYNQHDVNFEKYQPEYLLSHSCLMNNPTVFYEFYRQKMDTRNIEPNITHTKLAELEKSGKRISIVTQNIDSLHQKAGSEEVYEIHGTTDKNYCPHCKEKYPYEAIFDSKELIPICSKCGKGNIRPDVTLYEESLPDAFDLAKAIMYKSDLRIVAGTSLTVYPAANLLHNYFDENLVIINRDSTNKDSMAQASAGMA